MAHSHHRIPTSTVRPRILHLATRSYRFSFGRAALASSVASLIPCDVIYLFRRSGAYSGTAGASSSPPSQASAAAFASCQQASMDYPAYPTYPGNNYASYYGQNAGYFGQTPYSYAPYLPNGGLNPTGNGALSLTTNNSSASSSPTYQLAQLPPSLSGKTHSADANTATRARKTETTNESNWLIESYLHPTRADTNSHYHSTLDNSSPPLKTSSMHEIASLADCQVNAAAKKGNLSGALLKACTRQGESSK